MQTQILFYYGINVSYSDPLCHSIVECIHLYLIFIERNDVL